MNERESYWIKVFSSNVQDIGYNMSNGGEGNALFGELNPMYGKHHSEEIKAKISESQSGKKHSIETKLKMSEALQGEKHPRSKLTEEDVKVIKQMLRDGITQKEIASTFNINQTTVSHIKNGRKWSHVE